MNGYVVVRNGMYYSETITDYNDYDVMRDEDRRRHVYVSNVRKAKLFSSESVALEWCKLLNGQKVIFLEIKKQPRCTESGSMHLEEVPEEKREDFVLNRMHSFRKSKGLSYRAFAELMGWKDYKLKSRMLGYNRTSEIDIQNMDQFLRKYGW